MELLQLRYFAELANMEHLSKTAEKLMISPPSLSSTIKKLENELGTQLFDRSRQQMRLNENGRIFYRYVQTALNTLDCGVLTLTQTNCPILKVALTSFPVWIDMIYAYEQSHPEVVLEYTVITLDELNNAPSPFPWNFFLGIIEDVDTGRFQSHKVFPPERPVVLMSVHNPLAGRSDIRLEELKDENFISVRRENSSAHNFMMALCRQAGFEPRKVYYGDYLMRVKLVQQNRGVNITTMVGATVNAIPLDTITAIPLSSPIMTRTQAISWEQDKLLSDMEQTFLDFAVGYFKEHPLMDPKKL
ncbi:LysR family transcriptional regulator [Enterocloster aldenensis]|uniref:LysR family transcriptional regulator n=1 Tax=Enterocloster aldenensis TaxID=358742 RepID=UPI000E426D7E|nr:LysR family transcriptional regulator [Enterocloster aldenensis]